MIGTTVKLGFDGAAVDRGLKSIKGKFQTLGKTMQKDFTRFSIAGGLATWGLVDAVKDTSDFAGEINDLSNATGAAIPDLLRYFEMLRIGGAESVNVGKMLSNFATKMSELKEEGGASEAVQKLGMSIDELDGMTFSNKLEAVMKAVGKSELGFEDLSKIVSELFGGRAGFKMMAMMKDFEANSARAAKTTERFGESAKDAFGPIDEMADAMGRFRQLRMEVTIGLFEKFKKAIGGSGGVDKFFDSIDVGKITDSISKATEGFLNLGKSIIAGATNVKDFVGGWENLGIALIALNFAPTMAAIVQMTTSLKLMSVATWAAAGPWLALAAAIAAVYDVMNTNKIGEFITNLFPDDEVIKFGEMLSDLMDGFSSMEGFNARLEQMKTDFGNFGMQPGAAPTSAAGEATAKQLEEQTRILKDIRAQGNVAVWA